MANAVAERRFRIVAVSARYACELLRGQIRLVNLPPDAIYVRAMYDFASDSLHFMCASAEWDRVADGCVAPDLQAEVEVVPVDVFVIPNAAD